MYDVDSIFLNGIKSLFANSLDYVRVKGGESEYDWQETMLPHVPLALQCLYGCSDERSENGRVEIACPLAC